MQPLKNCKTIFYSIIQDRRKAKFVKGVGDVGIKAFYLSVKTTAIGGGFDR